jgi:hypothetical protein
MDFLIKLIDTVLDEGSILHIWGHSWEIEEQELWMKLEELFSLIASRHPKLCTIGELITEARFSDPEYNATTI